MQLRAYSLKFWKYFLFPLNTKTHTHARIRARTHTHMWTNFS